MRVGTVEAGHRRDQGHAQRMQVVQNAEGCTLAGGIQSCLHGWNGCGGATGTVR